jgi:hypothetical protein
MLKDNNKIHHILTNNKYDASILSKINNKKEQKQVVERIKWAKVTHIDKERKFITKIFKNTSVKFTFTIDNTTENLLATLHKQNINKYEERGIYQLTCPACKIIYIEQTGSTLKPVFMNTYGTSNTETRNPNSLNAFYKTNNPSDQWKELWKLST